MDAQVCWDALKVMARQYLLIVSDDDDYHEEVVDLSWEMCDNLAALVAWLDKGGFTPEL